jgi:hypothetical protein
MTDANWWHWWAKKANNSKMGNGIYFKIAGYVDLDMLHNFAIKLNIYLLKYWNIEI